MNQERGGFALYLTFLVTTLLFFWSLTGLDIVLCALDMSRSGLLDAVSFQAADGGLEIGLARVKKDWRPFEFKQRSRLGPYREVEITVTATAVGDGFDIRARACLFDGNKPVAVRTLMRQGVGRFFGRLECGTFLEES
jgi:hypothetical protein